MRGTTNKDLAELIKLYKEQPTMIGYRMRDILECYRIHFRNFVAVNPMSFHGHVSDAFNPYILGSIIQFLLLSSSASINRIKASSPRLAVMDGLYGAGYGPLAYHAVGEWDPPVACGEEPTVVTMDPETLGKQLQKWIMDSFERDWVTAETQIRAFVDVKGLQEVRVCSEREDDVFDGGTHLPRFYINKLIGGHECRCAACEPDAAKNQLEEALVKMREENVARIETDEARKIRNEFRDKNQGTRTR